MVEDIENLRAKIEGAFANSAYPGDEKIAMASSVFPDYEGNQVSAFLVGKHWQQITHLALINDYPGDPSSCMRFLQADGFRYFLPAFLTIALDFKNAGDIADSACNILTFVGDKGSDEDKKIFLDRVTALSDCQKAVVVAALEFFAAHYQQAGYPDNPAADALTSYWKHLHFG